MYMTKNEAKSILNVPEGKCDKQNKFLNFYDTIFVLTTFVLHKTFSRLYK